MQAFMLRLRPGEAWALDDHVPEALRGNEIMIGWSRATGLLNPALSREAFSAVIVRAYPQYSARTMGVGVGNMWRFVREMKPGDLVVVPDGSSLFVAKVMTDAAFSLKHVAEDAAHRRSVEWLNGKRPVERRTASEALQARLRNRRTCLNITDLIDDVHGLLG